MGNFKYEIPFNKDKKFGYRFFEIMPGVLTWTVLSIPFLITYISVNVAAIMMIAYIMLWFVKAITLNVRALQGWRLFEEHTAVDWEMMIADVKRHDDSKKWPKWHTNNLDRIKATPNGIKPDD
ncbi:hypothetical protein KBB49_02155, partial [Candidatus Saccharibacteria bacterium]|nr:hypothetical protein [Candidatus Saccharibacteria bacterium]